MRRRRVPEENAHSDRWLVSFADFMTLMFALFVVLFASAFRDKEAIQKVSAAVKDGFQDMGTFSSPPSIKSGVKLTKKQTVGSPSILPEEIRRATSADAGIDIAELHRKLNEAVGKEIERNEIAMRVTPEGFVISLRELGFFGSGDARLAPGAADKIKRIAAVLKQYGLDMRVEGNSDNVPIHNATFNSNWDLSTARAMAVAMMLIDESSVDPGKVSIVSYGEYHPTATNDTPEGRRENRRVDIVVVSPAKRSE